jgi:hypothetical protein
MKSAIPPKERRVKIPADKYAAVTGVNFTPME